MRLVLASASPRRAELLRAAGIEFDAIPSNVDEVMDLEETPDGFVRRVAQTKAQAVMPQAPGRVILGADSVVMLDNQVLGKPVDEAAARHVLRSLSGRDHFVVTAVCLIDPRAESEPTHTSVVRTRVEFAPLSDAEIDWYVASGEPQHMRGGYAIEGLASRFVTRVDGCHSNAIGLPVAVVYRLCRQAGLLTV